MLSNKIGIRSKDVFEAAQTKWNFLPFNPGLVGGHCIGVDPYYLVEKAAQLNMETKVITAGRSTNDNMCRFVTDQVLEECETDSPKILVLGITFKENVPDTRNSGALQTVKCLESRGADVYVHDPYFSEDEIQQMNIKPGSLDAETYDAILLLIPHKEYLDLSTKKIVSNVQKGGIFYDLKSVFDHKDFEEDGYHYMSL